MHLRILTLRYNEGLQGFPEDAVREAAAGHEVLEVREHFFLHGNIPHLALVLLLGDGATAGPRPPPRPEDDPGLQLPEALRPLYRSLREWRNEIDHWIKDDRRIPGYVRYMDDLALWADDKDHLFALAADLRERLATRLGLELKEGRTLVAPVGEGMPFLGWRVFPGLLRQQGTRLHRQRRLLVRREAQYLAGEIGADKLQDCVRALAGPRAFLDHGEPIRSTLDV